MQKWAQIQLATLIPIPNRAPSPPPSNPLSRFSLKQNGLSDSPADRVRFPRLPLRLLDLLVVKVGDGVLHNEGCSGGADQIIAERRESVWQHHVRDLDEAAGFS